MSSEITSVAGRARRSVTWRSVTSGVPRPSNSPAPTVARVAETWATRSPALHPHAPGRGPPAVLVERSGQLREPAHLLVETVRPPRHVAGPRRTPVVFPAARRTYVQAARMYAHGGRRSSRVTAATAARRPSVGHHARPPARGGPQAVRRAGLRRAGREEIVARAGVTRGACTTTSPSRRRSSGRWMEEIEAEVMQVAEAAMQSETPARAAPTGGAGLSRRRATRQVRRVCIVDAPSSFPTEVRREIADRFADGQVREVLAAIAAAGRIPPSCPWTC